jgi:hypothetical protein
VSEPLVLVRQARESLARALGAIQSTPAIPQELLDIAGVVAKGMSACHQMEKAGKAPAVGSIDDALTHVRSALAALQGAVGQHPTLMPAIEAVAGGLGPLVQAQRALSAGPQAAAALDATVLASSPASVPPPAAPMQQAAPVAVPAAPPPVVAPAPVAAPAPAAASAVAAPVDLKRASQHPPAQSLGIPGPEAIAADAPVLDVALGTHSASNFYKGLSGNDIIQHGGIFVATYKIPKSGTTVRMKVAMPGGYEFELGGVVTWIRDPVAGNPDAHPGFGARITHATVEGRDLIRRYVKNREPLFHDDL